MRTTESKNIRGKNSERVMIYVHNISTLTGNIHVQCICTSFRNMKKRVCDGVFYQVRAYTVTVFHRHST